MGHLFRLSLLAALICGFFAVGCEDQPQAAATTQPATAIDPKADAILKSMSETLKQAKMLEFKAMQIYDTPLESGQLIQTHCRCEVAVYRPNKLAVTSTGDKGCMMTWHDGKTLTLFNPQNQTYATDSVPQSNEAMLDELASKYGLVMPMSDFIFSDVYEILMSNVEAGEYIGETVVGRTLCHHLAFSQADIDWQIWVSADETPLPIKFVITYKTEPGRPRHMAMMKKWNLSPNFTTNTFKPVLPEKAKQITLDEMITDKTGG